MIIKLQQHTQIHTHTYNTHTILVREKFESGDSAQMTTSMLLINLTRNN